MANSVYDDGNTRLSRAEADAAGADSKTFPVPHGPEQLARHENQVGKGFTGADNSPGSGWTKKRKRRLIFGSSGLALVVAGVFGFSILQGPLQLIHLSQVLQRNNFGSEQTSAIRTNGLYRFYRTGDIGQTRVGLLGSKVFSKVDIQLKEVGIEYERTATGAPRTKIIDPSKHPASKDLPRARQGAALAKFYGAQEGDFQLRNGRFRIDMSRMKIGAVRSLTFSSLKALENGKISNAINKRVIAKFYNIPSLFHPLKRLAASAENKLTTPDGRKQAERERKQQLKIAEAPEVTDAKSKIRGQISSVSRTALTSSLITTESVCIARKISNDVVVLNRAAIVAPAVVEAIDKTAIGEQVKSGQDFNLTQLGLVVNSLKDDDGRTIWEADALQATAGNTKPSGKDLDPEYAQAFSKDTTARNIVASIGSVKILGKDVSRFACSNFGLAFQFTASLALLAGGVFTAGASWGVFLGKAGASAAASIAVIYFLQKTFTALLSNKAVLPETLSGPQGGNLLAYGAREAANINARASGGIELSGSEAAYLDKQLQMQEQKEFQSKKFFARLFDTNDYRSSASRLIASQDYSVSTAVSTVASSLNPKTLFTITTSPLFSNAKAAEAEVLEQYQWITPRYGIPQDIAEDPAYEDPYTNADEVVGLLKRDRDLRDRAMKCFGVKITESAPYDVIPEKEVNPAERSYEDGKCDDKSEVWKRIMLFVFDTRLMTSIACYEGDVEACSSVGISSTPSSITTPGSSPGETIDISQLGKNSDNIECAAGTKDLGVATSKYTGEFKKESGPMKIRLCQITDIPGSGNDRVGRAISGGAVVEARVSGAWAALAKKAKSDGVELTASSSFRLADSCGGAGDGVACARPGQSAHQTGWAIDFNNMPNRGGSTTDCATRARASSSQWRWMYDNAESFGIKQYSYEAWHWDLIPMDNRCGKDS